MWRKGSDIFFSRLFVDWEEWEWIDALYFNFMLLSTIGSVQRFLRYKIFGHKRLCPLIQSDRVPTRTLSKFSSTVPGLCKTILVLVYLWSGLALASAMLWLRSHRLAVAAAKEESEEEG